MSMYAASWFYLALGGSALAAPSDAFPAFPCQDGWTACIQGGEVVEPGLFADSEGLLNPADARIGWGDLAPTHAFDPFTGLSPYSAPPAVVHVVKPGPLEPDIDVPVVKPAKRKVSKRAIVAPVAPVRAPVSTPSPTVSPTVVPAPVPTKVERDLCDDLEALELPAGTGALSEEARTCLADRAGRGRLTKRVKASRLLIAHAGAAGETETWARLVGHHLDTLEQSDPDLCAAYARHLASRGPGSAFEAIRWADTALENRSVWRGRVHVQRTSSLYRLRAQASQTLWKRASEVYVDQPTAASRAAEEQARGRTKEFSRTWLEYDRAAGLSTDRAVALCEAAAGTASYCRE